MSISQIRILPAGPLRPYIREYHWIGSPVLLEEPIEEDNLPLPVSGLCFQLGEGSLIKITHGDIEKEALPDSYILPPSTRRFTVHYQGGQEMLAVIFLPAAFFEFFGWPVMEFTNKSIPLEATEGRREFLELRGRLQERKTPEQQAKVLDAFFLRKLRNKKADNAAIRQALAAIAQKGAASQQSLSEESRVSPRHLRRLFNQYLGMPPREFIRIYRFFRAYWILMSGKYDSLTRLALDCGYYDQAHFIHEFREFTGLSPHQFLKRGFLILDKVAWKAGQQ